MNLIEILSPDGTLDSILLESSAKLLIGFGPSLIYSPYHQHTCSAPPSATSSSSSSVVLHSLLIEFSAIHHQDSHPAPSHHCWQGHSNNNSTPPPTKRSGRTRCATRKMPIARSLGQSVVWSSGWMCDCVHEELSVQIIVLHVQNF